MKPTLSMLAALACLVAAPLAANAQEEPGGRILKLLDKDGDGTISKAEVTAMREKMFAKLDANSDGLVDRDEIEDARERIMEHASAAQNRLSIRFRRLDSDHSGGVTVAEFSSRTTFFDLADRDGDGKLAADELARVKDMIGNLR
jgi:Ca2+-binding EF-hand superfamily protein